MNHPIDYTINLISTLPINDEQNFKYLKLITPLILNNAKKTSDYDRLLFEQSLVDQA